jgi:MYXO-CTERM domain-containing protein
MRLPRSLVAPSAFLLSLAAPLFVSTTASAQEACGEQVCPKGFSCETVNVGCPAIACEGPDCPTCDGTEQVCLPAPCTSDADCAADMVCHTETHQECDDVPPCGADDGSEKVPECERVLPSNCSTVSTSSCVPRWYLPCTTAADCGAGFDCVEQIQGGCPGSPGSAGGGSSGGSAGEDSDSAEPLPAEPSPGADGGAPPADERPASDGGTDGCVFEPSGEFACVRIEVACEADSDCLPGWSCDKNNEGACWAASDGSTGCDPVDPPNVCYPPYENLGGGGFAEDGGATTGGPRGDDDSAPEAPNGSGSPAQSGDDTSTVKSGGGCSVGNAGTTGGAFGALALAFLGLFAARRRR